jgi:2-polyprenyl-6-methoxyphenol hydroxylase-like FAD-dependent oxidoreductase
MKAIKNKNIAIVGGGPGGLTLARILQMNGASVKVYERDLNREVRVQGATLDLHEESGLKALEVAGLMDAFNASYRPGADKLRVVDKNGNIVLDEHGADGGSYNRPEIDRGPLRKILLDSLKQDTVIWDSQFVSLSEQDDMIKLRFKNGSIAYADLVIAADGANSRIRPYITPIKPFYAGVSVIEGAVYNSEKASPRIHELLNDGKIFAMGDEKTLIVSSKGDGSLVFYAGIKSAESWLQDSGIDFKDKGQVFAWFKQEFADWSDIWDELFENAEPVFIPRPQYCIPLNQTWEALPNLTMLGDAAHLMPPYAGEGVNMAMLDALELAECLLSDDFANTHDAIAAYEKQMRARASETAAMTLEQTDSLHSADGLKNLVAMFNPE